MWSQKHLWYQPVSCASSAKELIRVSRETENLYGEWSFEGATSSTGPVLLSEEQLPAQDNFRCKNGLWWPLHGSNLSKIRRKMTSGDTCNWCLFARLNPHFKQNLFTKNLKEWYSSCVWRVAVVPFPAKFLCLKHTVLWQTKIKTGDVFFGMEVKWFDFFFSFVSHLERCLLSEGVK